MLRQSGIALAAVTVTLPSIASAAGPPGPLPHKCNPYAACDMSGICIGISAPLPSVVMDKYDEGKPLIEWHADRITPVKQFETLAEARSELIDSGTGHPGTWIFILPNDDVADAHGYDLYTIGVRGNGERALSKTFLKMACS